MNSLLRKLILSSITILSLLASPVFALGPDTFGYQSINSNDDAGLSFQFIDISATGTQLSFVDADALPVMNPNADDGVAPNISLAGLNGGLGFPFYGVFKTEIQMSTNGFLTFTLNGDADSLSNSCPVPSITPPTDMIAVLWDDLVMTNPPTTTRGGYVQSFGSCPNTQGGEGQCIIFQWDNADHFGGAADSFDIEAILYSNGNILMNYGPGNPELGSSSTTGLLSSGGTDGLGVCNTAASIPENHSILFFLPPQISLDMGVTVCPSDVVDPGCANTCSNEKSLIVAPGTKVGFCYKVVNEGKGIITNHDLFDSHFGTLFSNLNYALGVGSDAFWVHPEIINEDVTSTTGTWIGKNGVSAGIGTDSVTVKIDTDGDGVADSDEDCPLDPEKTEPGVCGCGELDLADLNGNGKFECEGEFGTVNISGQCVPGAGDCAYTELAPSACVGANGFLGQINIASVVNLQPGKLKVKVKLFDSAGNVQGQVSTVLGANIRQDFIVNDLGLQPDTIGTVCVETNAAADGAWSGGNTLYRPDFRTGSSTFGDGFDFALYYPFLNSTLGTTSVPLNTFHLGTNPAALVANWISIADGTPGDGKSLKGTLSIFDAQGKVVQTNNITIPDGGRSDFSGHDGLTGASNTDAIGLAQFKSNSSGGYFMTLTRYFYDCPALICNNFLTAFNIPRRPGTAESISGGVSTVNGEIAIVELNNISNATAAKAGVKVFNTSGASQGSQSIDVPKFGTRHVIVNQSTNGGFLAAESVGATAVDATKGTLSALSIFYKLNDAGVLDYAYAAPLVESPGLAQLSQFNSFIGHINDLEVVNTNSSKRKVSVSYIDFDGKTVFETSFDLPGKGVNRISNVALPSNSYGTVVINGDKSGIVARNYVSRVGQYTLPFPGE